MLLNIKVYLIKLLESIYLKISRNQFIELKSIYGYGLMIQQKSVALEVRDLADVEFKVFSQFGEDGILNYLCNLIEIDAPRIVEFGAGEFLECNSKFLISNRNASAFLVDSNKKLLDNVFSSEYMWKSTIHTKIDWVTKDNSQTIFYEGLKFLGGVDIFSIDLDGNDYWILEQLPLEGVKIVVLEINPILGHELALTIPYKSDFERYAFHHSGMYYGMSALAAITLMANKGFDFMGSNRVGHNLFFCKKNISNSGFHCPKDISKYFKGRQWNVRDSRDKEGKLSYISGDMRLKEIENLPLVDITNSDEILIRNLFLNLKSGYE